MTEKTYPMAQVSPKSRFSLIWIIPLTAALIAAWLAFKYYSERGTIITITFDEASGIEAKKTPIRYKDVQIGKVKKLSLTSDLKQVKVTAEIYPQMAGNLGSNTHFWVEKPRVSFQGVSGLDTLLSGVHIGIDPGAKGEPQEHYIGLNNPPIITTDKEGTRLALNTTSLGSLDIGSPIYYNKINVGEVTSYRLNPSNESIDVFIYVHKPYDEKIKTNTLFWNASGIELSVTSAGVTARLESLTSLLIGGIAFETPQNIYGAELNGETAFKLFDSHKLAIDDSQRLNKLLYVMYFKDTLHGLSESSIVEYSGVKVGEVENIQLEADKNNQGVKTRVTVSLYIDKFSKAQNKDEAQTTLQSLVKNGMQAQLTVDSLLTGAQFISLRMLNNKGSKLSRNSAKAKQLERFVLMPTKKNALAVFPTMIAKQSLLNFDATEISQELAKVITNVNNLVDSDDIKLTLSGLASTSKSISKITKKLDDQDFSAELVRTLKTAEKTTKEISALILDTRKTMSSISSATASLQKDAKHSMQTFNNVSNKFQRDTSKTLANINRVSGTLDKGLKSSLSEDSALQYRLQQLINNLSEASNSFSVLADTIQRKPNSVIFGK